MRALAALATLAACVAHAHPQSRDGPHPSIQSNIFIKEPINRLLTCSQTLGPTKCLTALSVWRAKRAIESFSQGYPLNSTTEAENFPWEEYNNTSNEEIFSQLCEGTEKLLQYRTLNFTIIPGYKLELKSKQDGKISVDFYKSEVTTARGKLKKQFYNIVPLLLIPGLIMSAILPFVLPAMKLATVASIMLNNMALTGAVFTLLRDNAFNDHSRPKVKYINAGWKNEEELYHIHENHGLSDHEAYSGGHIEAVDHDHDVKVLEEYPQVQHTFSKNWLKDGVELNIQYDPHKRRG
ncbi:uncharacterized protein LOC106141942 [Amyelois transitella]|uniref:uncharacterized protein LOC106141942 n=1 Tax=Amyelois transitella TaxID=680683 RepID=UPI00299075D8|nr:uncharacterized protein LOC106141942 [Amyelois transitella]